MTETGSNIESANQSPRGYRGGFGAFLGLFAGLVFSGWFAARAHLLTRAAEAQLRVGEMVEIAGPTLDGGSIDLADYRGRLVLVDCWATWCGPCVAEVPNIRAAYDQFHSQGLEVIGVSLDFDRAALDRFVTARSIPWPQIYFESNETRGIENPIARKYGIDTIPCLFLVDRDGKLLAEDLRGSEIGRAVARSLAGSMPWYEHITSPLMQIPRWLGNGLTRSPWWLFIPCGFGGALVGLTVERAVRRSSRAR